MTSAQVVETSVNVTSNSPSQDYTHPDDHNLPNYDMTPGFKPFTVILYTINQPYMFVFQYVHNLVPRGQYTSGKGSSAVGLTAYVTRDPETRQLVLQT